jgi:hypothetical protein
MDPKSIANLDPKLRETYERVMGNTAPATPAAATPAAPPAPEAPVSAVSPPAMETASPTPPPDLSAPVSPDAQLSPVLPSEPSPSLSAPANASFNTSPFGTPSTPGMDNQATVMQPLMSPASAAQAAPGGKGSLIKVIYIFGGIVFFVVYIFFWIKIFNYQLPF